MATSSESVLLARPLAHVFVLEFACVRMYVCTYRLVVSLCVSVFVMCRIVRELMHLATQLPREFVRLAMFLSVCESVRLARPLANVFVSDG